MIISNTKFILHLLTLIIVVVNYEASVAQEDTVDIPDTINNTSNNTSNSTSTTSANGASDVSQDSMLSHTFYGVILAEFKGYGGNFYESLAQYKKVLPHIKDQDFYRQAFNTALYFRDREFAKKILKQWNKYYGVSERNLTSHIEYAILISDQEKIIKYSLRYFKLSKLPTDEKLLAIGKSIYERVESHIAVKIYRQIHDMNPKDIDAAAALLSFTINKKNSFEAVELAKEMLNIFPGNAEIVTLYSQALRKTGDINRSKNVLLNANLTFRENPKLKYAASLILLSEKRYTEAIQELKKVAKIDPTNWRAIRLLASNLLFDYKLRDQADPYLYSLLSFPETSNFARYFLGVTASRRGEFAIAESHFREIYRGERYVNARIELSQVYQKQGKNELAEEELISLSEEIDNETSLGLVLANLTYFYQINQKYDKASTILEEALKKYPNNQDLLYQGAMLALDLNQVDKALHELWKILVNNPESATFMNAYGYTLADKTNRYDEAYKYIKQSLELEPNNPAIIDSMGWVLYKQKLYKQSLQYLQKAYEIEPDEEIGAHLVEVLRVNGKKSKAKKLLRTLKKKYPFSKFLK